MEYGPNTTYLRAFERAYDDPATRRAQTVLGLLHRRDVFFTLALLPAAVVGLLVSWSAAVVAVVLGFVGVHQLTQWLAGWLGRRAQRASEAVRRDTLPK